MVLSILSQLPDLSDAELDELALAVCLEQSRRLSVSDAPAEPASEPAEAAEEARVFVTAYGRCWHASRDCRQIRRSRTVREVALPTDRRPCKTCCPPAVQSQPQASAPGRASEEAPQLARRRA